MARPCCMSVSYTHLDVYKRQSQWWKYLLDVLPADSVESRLSRYLLPLPLDQRYTPDDMRELAALVLQLKGKGESA